MASWLQKQFHRAEELLEVVDRTAGNLAVIRERDGVGYASSDDQQSGSEGASGRPQPQLPRTAAAKEKRQGGSPNKHPPPLPGLLGPPAGQVAVPHSRGAGVLEGSASPESVPAGNGHANGAMPGPPGSSAEEEAPHGGAGADDVELPAARNAAAPAGELLDATAAAGAGRTLAEEAATQGRSELGAAPDSSHPGGGGSSGGSGGGSSSNGGSGDNGAAPPAALSPDPQSDGKSTAEGMPAPWAEDEMRGAGTADRAPAVEPDELEGQPEGDSGKEGHAEPDGGEGPREDALLPGVPSLTVQQELDEARGLVKMAAAAGPTKEARLARICQQLSTRLQEYKAENAQLEELIAAERERYGSTDETVRVLQQQLASAQADTVAVEASSAAAISAKNAELEALASTLSEAKRHTAMLEGKLASLQATTDVITKTRNMSEARMLQALKEELMEAERRAEEERIAHAETRQAATQREVELEQRVTESVAALTRMQRVVDDRTNRADDLEEKISLLEVECAAINQELQQAEQRLRREQKRPQDEGGMSAQVQAWKEEAERARASLHEAEAKLAAEEANAQKLRVELEARRRDGDSSHQQAHAELEKRFRELTELLYLKQTQLEALSSEKQAALLQLEKESKRFREAKAQAERDKTMRRNLSAFTDDEEQGLRSLDALGVPQRRGMGKSIHSAAKILDSGAVTAGRFLWRRPLARVVLLLYLMFLHMMLMYFLHRLQDQAEVILSLRTSASSARDAFMGRLR